MGDINDVTWYAMGLMLTTIGLFLSYRAYHKKGLAAGVRGVGWSLLPFSLALTGTLELAGDIADDIGRWAVHLVFSPLVWLGIVGVGISVVLLGASRFLGGRSAPSASAESPKQLPKTSGKKAAHPIDDELADIEEILRKHGIQ